MLQDMLTTYKYGWKTSYYQNTYDFKSDPSEEEIKTETTNSFEPQVGLPDGKPLEDEEECEACAI